MKDLENVFFAFSMLQETLNTHTHTQGTLLRYLILYASVWKA